MPLEILVIVVVVGVLLIVIAVRLSGTSRPFELADENDARAVFLSRFSEERPGECIVSADRKAAFLRLESGRTGLVAAFGSRYICRVVGPGDVKKIEQDGRGRTTVRFADFTYPGGRYRFCGSEQAIKVANWLKG